MIELNLSRAFAVIQEEADQGGEVELAATGKAAIDAAVTVDETGIGNDFIDTGIDISK